jgi:hypothetical protein
MSTIKTNAIQTVAGKPILNSTGSILQVVQTLKTNSFSATSTGNNVWVDITGLSASITPSSSSSKILVMYTVYSSHALTTYGRSTRLVRGSTPIAVGDLSGSTPQATTNAYMAYAASMVCETATVLDSPATTSSTTYKVQFSAENTNSTYYVNIPGSITNDGRSATTVSSITLMEISA